MRMCVAASRVESNCFWVCDNDVLVEVIKCDRNVSSVTLFVVGGVPVLKYHSRVASA
jgi:hypothetical protein